MGRRLLPAGALTGAVVLSGAGSAAAHTELTGTSPKAGATLVAVPGAMPMSFTDRIDPQFAEVAVSGPGGHDVRAGDVKVQGGSVTQALQKRLGPGVYGLAYRVVSADGHPVSGQQRFTLDEPAPAVAATPTRATVGGSTPSARPPPAGGATVSTLSRTAPTSAAAADTEGGAESVVLLVAGATGLALLVVGAVGARRRSRRLPGDQDDA